LRNLYIGQAQKPSPKRDSEMKLKHEPNTYHWCGDIRGPHPNCPANGHTCSKCRGECHFVRVCLESSTGPNNQGQRPQSFWNTPQCQGTSTNNRSIHAIHTNNQYKGAPREFIHAFDNNQPMYYTDEAPPQQSTTYAIEQRDNTDQSATSDKYFTTVPSSSTRDKFYSLKLQIDSAATCNTISIETIRRLFPDVKLENQHTCCTHMGTVNL